MQMLHPEYDLRKPVHHDLLGQSPFLLALTREQRVEVPAGAVRHDDEDIRAVHE